MSMETKDALVAATEACVTALKHADNANELEAFRNAAVHAGDKYKRLARKYLTAGDPRRDIKVDAALDELESVIAGIAARDARRATIKPQTERGLML